MIHLIKRTPPPPDFPERLDLPRFTDKEACAALSLLRALVVMGHADVYTAAGSHFRPRPLWNVWTGGKRTELDEWAAGVLCRPLASFPPERSEGGATC